MEHLVKTFYRVAFDLDTPEATLASIAALPDPTSPSPLTDQDRRRVLDFPEPDQQSAAIAASSNLTKPELLKRAASSPQDLTDSEITLLKHRYWADHPKKVRKAWWNALRALGDGIDAVVGRLEELRALLYEEDEARALGDARQECFRRSWAASRAEQNAEDQAALTHARPWVRRLWDEDETRSAWGYGVFYVPSINEVTLEEYHSRRDVLVWNARGSVGCPPSLGVQCKLESLAWPGEDGNVVPEPGDDPAGTFRRLRERFVAVREEGGEGVLKGRMLRNVFLVVDRDAADVVLARSGTVDDMWVWAVDPDYADDAAGGAGEGYRGFMKVRVQQLMHNFFNLRYFHAGEYPMGDLWAAAQRSRGGLFVSVDPAESGLWTVARDVGTALRTRRYIQG